MQILLIRYTYTSQEIWLDDRKSKQFRKKPTVDSV